MCTWIIADEWSGWAYSSRSTSSASSTSSLTSKHQHLESRNSEASTSKSNKNRINQDGTERVTLERRSSLIVNEAAVQTNVPFSKLNPSRDGIIARRCFNAMTHFVQYIHIKNKHIHFYCVYFYIYCDGIYISAYFFFLNFKSQPTFRFMIEYLQNVFDSH